MTHYARAGQTWTEDEEDTLERLHGRGLSAVAISEYMGRSPFAIECAIKRLNITQTGGHIMSTGQSVKFLETKTFLEGRDIDTYSPDEMYSLIARQEAKVAKLNAITHKPESLKKEMAVIDSQLIQLIVYLDAKEQAVST